MAPRKIPARLDVLLAPKARKAVVLRRGPAKLVCTVGWNLTNDTFQLGQWMKGRIHAFCCDLSPDGKYFVYYVMKGHNFQGDYDWTAISRTPYLKAISRWKQSAGLPGGGLFLTENKYWLNNGWSAYQECDEVVQEPHYPGDEFTFDCRNVYIRRQLRDGWKLVNKVGDIVGLELLTFEKSLNEKWVIRNKFDTRHWYSTWSVSERLSVIQLRNRRSSTSFDLGVGGCRRQQALVGRGRKNIFSRY
jgi:hypothetical protein